MTVTELDERLNDFGYINVNKFPKGKFKMISVNVRSLLKQGPDIKELIETTKPEILCMQEIWHSNFNMPGYKHFKIERSAKRGGGVSCVCKNSMDFQLSDQGIDDNLEFIVVKNKKIEILNIYRPPNGSQREAAIKIDNILGKLDRKKIIMVCGDFNTNFMGNGTNTSFITDVFERRSLLLCTLLPTRISNTSATLIDAIFTNFTNTLNTGVITTSFSDHLAPFITFDGASFNSNNFFKTVTKPNESKEALENLSTMLTAIPWQEKLNNLNADETNICISSTIDECKNICCEQITIRQTINNTKIKPWFTKGLLVSRFRKEKLHLEALKKKNPTTFSTYKNYNKIFTKVCKKSKAMYYENFYKKFANNSRKLWRETNDVIGRVKKEKHITKRFKKGGRIITSKKEIADEFNRFFSSIGEKLSSEIPDTGDLFTKNLPSKPKAIFKFELINQEIVAQIIDSMESKRSSSFDSVSNFHVKKLKSSLLLPLTIAINRSLQEGLFPSKFKIAKVIPLFKAGDSEDFNNFRPISLLATLSKIYEKVVHKQLYDFFSEHYLTDCQFGFRTKTETSHCITNFLNNMYKNKDKKYHLSILIDCKKAFDSVKLSKLLKKLYLYGVRGAELAWFTSYLTERQQAVEYDGVVSCILDICYGVPQGSILGPLLFLIYINDLPSAVRFLVNLYADDTSFQLSSNSIKELEKLANLFLKDAAAWFIQNSLTLHPLKTKFLVFGRAKKLEKTLQLYLDGHRLEQIGEDYTCKSVKFLGVLLDDGLTWREHINLVASKLRKVLFTLIAVKSILPTKTKLQLYNALFKPHIDYCLVIWGNALDTKVIKMLQKKAIRAVYNKKKFAHAEPLLKKSKVLNFNDSYTLACLKFMRKVTFYEAPYAIVSLFNFHYRKRRWTNVFDEHFPSSEYWNRNPIFQLPKIWNRSTLPKDLNVTKKTFTENIKNALIAKYYSVCEENGCTACFFNNLNL